MTLDELEPVEKCYVKIEGENTPIIITVTVLSVGDPTTSNVVARTAIAPLLVLSLSYLSHLVNEGYGPISKKYQISQSVISKKREMMMLVSADNKKCSYCRTYCREIAKMFGTTD